MKKVGVREFRDGATKYLAGGEPLEIERHGKTLGYFVPAHSARVPARRKSPEEIRQAFEQLDAVVERVLTETGMTRDELADLFDLSKPFPYDSDS